MSASAIKKRLREHSSKEKAAILQRFFKTGPGEYAQGDIFIGVVVPDTRKIVKEYLNITVSEVQKLLRSPVHEERLAALLILVSQFNSANRKTQNKIYDFYLRNAQYINNWDLVDLTAHHIIGGFLKGRGKYMLRELAKSKNLWKRRMSIVATYYYIRENDFKQTLEISDMLIGDKEDLIHKAVGWMLREVGKRDPRKLESYLNKRIQSLPRTTLRYAIERFPESKRKSYLKK